MAKRTAARVEQEEESPAKAAKILDTPAKKDDASLLQRQLALALAQQETAQAQVGMAVNNLGRANDKLEGAERVGDTKKVKEAKEEVKEAKQEVKEAKEEVKEAEQKVKEAKEEVKEAEQKVKEAKDWCQKLLSQKLEFGAGDALLNTIGAKWDYCGRDDLVRDLQVPFGVLCEHKGADADKQNHPLLITFASPGQGKSRFLSELPAMIEECRVKLNTEQVQKYQKTLAFLITCENGTSPADWATVELNAGRFV
ncbi:CRN108, partial [Symbiodinium microadriaticum]